MQGSNCFSGAFILYSVRNEQLGAMRQKMAIFKVRNSVCKVHIFDDNDDDDDDDDILLML